MQTIHELNKNTDTHAFTEPETQLWLESKASKSTYLANDQTNGYPMFQKFRIKRYEKSDEDFLGSTSDSAERRRKIPFLYKQLESASLQKNSKTCTRCHTTNSPEWRRGPDGHKTYVYFKQ